MTVNTAYLNDVVESLSDQFGLEITDVTLHANGGITVHFDNGSRNIDPTAIDKGEKGGDGGN